MDSPLMYEDESPEKGGSNTGKFQFEDDQLNDILGLDPQLECSVDIQQLLLNSTKGSQPVKESELLLGDIADTKQDLFDLVHSTEESYMQTDQTAPINFDLSSESSIDIQALLQITRPVIKPEKSELPSCILNGIPSSPEEFTVDFETTSSGRPSSAKKSRSKKRVPDKGTPEYVDKRARNNVAVRRSRTKAKQRQQETEGRVTELSTENERLQKKVDLLSKELNVLKSLFLNVGAALPANFEAVLQK